MCIANNSVTIVLALILLFKEIRRRAIITCFQRRNKILGVGDLKMIMTQTVSGKMASDTGRQLILTGSTVTGPTLLTV